MYATERGLELVMDDEITSKDIRNKPGKPGEGIGIVEAARGTLIHHYQLDENALAKKVNLVVATTHNAPGICMSVKNAAQGIIKNGVVNDGLLNKVEMAFRAYDPCFACATHFAIGEMPLEVNVFDSNQKLLKSIRR
jgi:F420-non-reducing hydrogenase large subunit